MSDPFTPNPLDGCSYYHATANRQLTLPSLAGESRADVCVVGAGLTGLSAALELVLAGRKVIVLEAGDIAWGASGRNGGQVCIGFSPGMAVFEKALGYDAAKACFAVADEAVELIRQRIKTHHIDCDFKSGYLVCASKPSHMAELEDYGAELSRYGCDNWHLLNKAELEYKLASTVYHGAIAEDDAGHIHTLNYALGLADAIVQHGGIICQNSRVVSIDQTTPARVNTANGTVIADQVIVACNAYLGKLVPGLDGRVMPVASYVIATEPLSEERARSLIRDDEAVGDSNFVVDYFRLTADNRMLFGGRCSYSGRHPKDLATNMRPRLLRVFPQLADVKIDYAWGGYIGITHNRLPDVGRIGNNLYFAQGYCGHGVALTGIFGKLMAEAIIGESERLDIFTRIKHRPFPGGVLRRPALTLGMLYYRLRDILS